MKSTIVDKSELLTESMWERLVEVVQKLDAIADEMPNGTVMPGAVAELLYRSRPALEALDEAPVMSDTFRA